MDKWSLEHDEEVVIQTGFSTYEPQKATWRKLYPYKKMVDMVDKARIIITHGGPSSFIMPLQIRKVPIVVPRKHEFDEHVNNHQVVFCNQVAKRQGSIIVVEDVTTSGKSMEETVPIVRAQADVEIKGLVVSLNRNEKGTGEKTALKEISELYGFPTAAIVSMPEVVEIMKEENRLDADVLSRIEAYYEQYGAKE
jgi:orotate phosphoribosyltransferase